VIAYESGIADSVDPLGGSHYVEYLTDRNGGAIEGVIREIADYGGVVKAIEDGYLQRRIARSAHERKTRVSIPASRWWWASTASRTTRKTSRSARSSRAVPALRAEVMRKYEKYPRRARRRQAAERRSPRSSKAARANDRENLMPYLVDCCHAYVTVGEMVERLKQQWGEFKEPVKL
jgi:methylmalonyl-CoA mutase N-terminal domain/subunit